MVQQKQGELDKALIEAAENGHVEVCLFLIEQGANVNATNWHGLTPLHLTAVNGHVEVCRLFIERGANVNATNRYGRAPLHYAVRYGYAEACRLLVNNGADVNATDSDGWTPLHWAAANGRLEVCRLLVNNGADVNATDSDNSWTPLHWAALNGRVEVCRLLIQAGADVNATDNDIWNPLGMAIERNRVDILVYFYVHGVVNFHQPDRNGRTPWDRLTAQQQGTLTEAKVVHQEKIAILQTKGLPIELARLVMGYL